MPYRNSVEILKFPVRARLRNPKHTLVIEADGKVSVEKKEGGSCLVVQHPDPSSVTFRPFLEFWAVVFADENPRSLAFNQLVRDLIAGRVQQDIDCPYLFIDIEGADPTKDWAYPVLKADLWNGSIVNYNPDPHFVNQAYALAENTRVKFYNVISECEDGNAFNNGYSVSVTNEAGKFPEFHPEYDRAFLRNDIMKLGETMLGFDLKPQSSAGPDIRY